MPRSRQRCDVFLFGQDFSDHRFYARAQLVGLRGHAFRTFHARFDLDLSRGLLHVRASKNGKDRFVPINQTIRTMLERLPRTSEYVFPSTKTEGRLVDVKFRFDKAKKEAGLRDFVSTTCVTLPPPGWPTAELMRSRWPKSSDGQMFEWLCVTLTLPTRRSAERLKIWSNRLDQVTNR
jgi:hypothetical protein